MQLVIGNIPCNGDHDAHIKLPSIASCLIIVLSNRSVAGAKVMHTETVVSISKNNGKNIFQERQRYVR